ncbi:MAG: hypothetical protein MPN21_04765 [Thermoanaerobaculia bacterium]|nr:hypothetical protein [Thermoanaerobaculia bacterium]
MTTPALSVEAAVPGDDDGIRTLLRRQVMGGSIRLTFERDPDFRRAATIEGQRHHMFVARRGSGEVVGLASRAVRRVWVDGESRLVGYLAQLRRIPELRGGRHLLRAGFDACAATRQNDELPVDLTSIVCDNVEARRLLERGVAGLPSYRRLCRYWTLTFETGGRGVPETTLVGQGTVELLPAIADCLQRNLRRFEFAPVWTAGDLGDPERCRDLAAADFLTARDDDGDVRACLAIWDQRRFKQVVVRGYDARLTTFRPLINVGLTCLRRPRLPAPGTSLALGFLSHVAVDDDDPRWLLPLLTEARRVARKRGLDYLSVGFARRHPLAASVRRATGARVLESILYLVGTEDEANAWSERCAQARCPHVEAATL